jgi:hypothetical protein
MKSSYAQELMHQMEAEKDKKARMWNEMSDKERELNVNPLQAFETMERSIGHSYLPGYKRDTTKERTNFARFNRKALI